MPVNIAIGLAMLVAISLVQDSTTKCKNFVLNSIHIF